MTQTSERPVTPAMAPAVHAVPAVDDLEPDLAALRVVLADHPFPTHQDDLLAALVGRREPVRLARRLTALSRTRAYVSLDDVCDEVRRRAETP